ncbi:glycosyltransferase family 31 protein [Amniculicola lignicola CBS 123094]|uniref:N-acetylgalactosaminide beta-1,3-galactosyltransferase n=1 Tax=Amniculicola lignicola CBS 123094 TaxID=1392246 RepID=A0A6A5WIL8_9PLEO|nr:glycosyltransferase family 31 protein [Amniculicola lignicola CBS 123094]
MVRLTPTRLLCLAAASVGTTIFLYHAFAGERGFDVITEHSFASTRPSDPKVSFGEPCSPFKNSAMKDVTIVLKFGAAEVDGALPAYLERLSACKPNLLLFSDRKDKIQDYDIVDVLANLRPEYKYDNPDFDVYDRLQNEDRSSGKSADGWKLDKYKFLPMMEIAAHMRPQSQWFVFIELDTYVNWDNMYRFLTHFSPSQSHYFGSPIWPKKKTVFAHGGSGFVLSRGAMNRVVARGRMFAENQKDPGTHLFGKDVRRECCGDELLAKVLKECSVTIRGYWPMFNGEKPSTVRFNAEQWCEGILTMHHLNGGDFADMHRWEENRQQPKKPLTFEELFTYIESSLGSKVDDWSNMSEDVTLRRPNAATKSFEACFGACLRDSKCIQYEYSGDICRLGHVMRLGHKESPIGAQKWASGWVKDRIQAFKAAHSPCTGAHFVHPNPWH